MEKKLWKLCLQYYIHHRFSGANSTVWNDHDVCVCISSDFLFCCSGMWFLSQNHRVLLWCKSVNVVGTFFPTEQCYWNQSRCIEIISHVEKACPPCCSYNWSMVEYIPGLLPELFIWLLVTIHACPWCSLLNLFSVLGGNGNMHKLLASCLSLWRGGKLEDWARTCSNPHNGACSPLNQVWFLTLRAWGDFLYLSASSVHFYLFLYNWSTYMWFIGFLLSIRSLRGWKQIECDM